MRKHSNKPAISGTGVLQKQDRASAIILLLIYISLNITTVAGETGDDGTNIDLVLQKVRSDIRQAVKNVNRTHADIAASRSELENQLKDLRATIKELETEHSKLLQRTEAIAKEQRSRNREIIGLRENLQHVDELVTEYRQSIPGNMTGSMVERYRSKLAEIDNVLKSEAYALREKSVSSLLNLWLDHADRSLGGTVYRGKAQDQNGRIVSGSYAEFGPTTYFQAATAPQPNGLAVELPGSLTPTVISPSAQTSQRVKRLFKTGSSLLPFDPTQGTALQLRQERATIWGHLRKGKVVMVPLLILGGTCGIIAIYKFLQLLGLTSPRSVHRIESVLVRIQNGKIDEALEMSGMLRKPLSAVIKEGIKHRGAAKEQLEEVMYEKLVSQTPSLEKLLAPLAVCASAAPLLGLLGTVTGMIHTFRLINIFGTGDAQMLSSGISEALITTQVGLMIAVPALLIHAYLSRRVRRAVTLTQQAAAAFVNHLKLGNQDMEST